MLSLIASDFFQKSPVLLFPLIALGLFMLVFFVVTVRTVMTKKAEFDRLAMLPLQAEEGRRGAGEEAPHE